MSLRSFEEVRDITKKLVSIPSIVREPNGETNVAKEIVSFYQSLPYFKEHPEQVYMFETIEDVVLRHSVISYLKGTKGNSKKTVIMMGHIDTVGVDDFGDNYEYAFKCDELPEILKTMDISKEVLADIESGEYLFGRGALDMKAGVAGHMYLMKYFSEHLDEIDGNIVVIAECDEEDNSKGIISALYELEKIKAKEDFDYIACINADYSTGFYNDDKNKYVYLGAIGKLLPSFYVTGKETHVGSSFQGFDPNLLLAEITRTFSLNTEYCDEAYGEVTVPPISLKQQDFKVGYTVQTALSGLAYFNYFAYSQSPADVIKKAKEVAEKSYDNVVEYLNTEYEKYCKKINAPIKKLPWKKRVYTWEELVNEIAKEKGEDFRTHIFEFAKKLNEEQTELDLRLFSVKVIEEAMKFVDDKSPICVIFYGSVFSARIEVTGKTPLEANLKKSLENAVEKVQPESSNPILIKMFYPYIADASFMAISDDMASIDTLLNNMPSSGTKHKYPLKEIMNINVPVVNIGTIGKDGHMLTERVHMEHTFQSVPNMSYEVIKELLA